MGFCRQKYWSGLPCLTQGDLPDPGIKPGSLALQADSLPLAPPGANGPPNTSIYIYKQLQKTAIHCSILQNLKETFCYLLHEEISQRTYSTDLP